jgi:hypothetical protein
MRIDVLTLFPEMFPPVLNASIVGRALASGVAEVHLHNIRDWATDKHAVVDDYAYGGGPGMVMKPEPLAAAIEGVQAMAKPKGRTILLTPQGRVFNQAVVDELVKEERGAGSDRRGRRGRAAYAGDSRLGRFVAGGVALRRIAGVSALYPSGGVSRMEGTGYTSFR